MKFNLFRQDYLKCKYNFYSLFIGISKNYFMSFLISFKITIKSNVTHILSLYFALNS